MAERPEPEIEEPSQEEDTPLKRRHVPSMDDPGIPSHFVNNAFVTVNKNDISVTLLEDYEIVGEEVSKPVARFAFSHAGFISTIRYLKRYADFLESVYGEHLPSLTSFEEARVFEMFDHFVVRPSEKE